MEVRDVWREANNPSGIVGEGFVFKDSAVNLFGEEEDFGIMGLAKANVGKEFILIIGDDEKIKLLIPARVSGIIDTPGVNEMDGSHGRNGFAVCGTAGKRWDRA